MWFWGIAGELRDVIRYSKGAEVLSNKLETLGRMVEDVKYVHAKLFKPFCLFRKVDDSLTFILTFAQEATLSLQPL